MNASVLKKAIQITGFASNRVAIVLIGISLARENGGDAYSQFALINTTASLIFVFVAAGFVPSAYRHLGRKYPANLAECKLFVELAILTSLAVFLIIYATYYFHVVAIDQKLFGRLGEEWIFGTTLAFGLSLGLFQFLSAVMQGTGQQTLAAASWALSSITIVALTIIWKDTTNTIEIVSIITSVFLLFGLCLYLIAVKRLRTAEHKNSWREEKISLQALASDIGGLALPLLGYVGIFSSLAWYCGKELSAIDISPHDTLSFNVSYQWFGLILFVPGLLTGLWVPELAAISHDQTKLTRIVKRAIIQVSVFTGICCALCLVAIPIIFRAYQLNVDPISITTFALFLLSAWLSAAATPITNLLIALGRTMDILIAAFAWGATVILSLILFGKPTSSSVASSFALGYGIWLIIFATRFTAMCRQCR